MTREPFIAHSELTNEIYIVSGREKYRVTEQAIKAVDAIKALEQQTSEDCISRQAVIEHICESKECYKEECKGRTLKRCPDLQWVFDLPSVTPRTNLAETSQDCISRAKALDTLKTSFLGMSFERYKKAKRMFEQLPSVTPKYTDEEIDKAQAVEQAYVDKMVELAVEEMKRPKGKWIEIEIDAGEFIYKCTKCGMRVINPYKYCPICGSYNGGEKE